jgi:Domain of unknown function (DUF4266)
MKRTLSMAVTLALLCGCSALTPSVKPYERETLADPLMSVTRDPLSTKYLEHVYDVREAARGGESGQGGGCGCN